MVIFIYFCTSFSADKLTTRFETLLARNGVNVYIRFTYNFYVSYIALKAVLVTNIHYLLHFFLLKFLIAFLVQLSSMSSKHIRISSFGESQVSSPHLAPTVYRSTNKT
jgi:hypothetical protein